VKRKLLLAAFVCLAIQSIPGAALAYGEAHYTEAVDAYQRGELDRARVHFYAYIKSHPGVYQAHYQLANTLTQKADLDNAILQYQRTLQLKPDKLTAARCQTALKQLAYLKSLPPRQQPVNPDERKQREIEYNNSKAIAMQVEQTKRLQAQKDQILADSERAANSVLSEATGQVQSMTQNANYRLRNQNGDWIGVGLPVRMEREVMEPAEREAARIRQEGLKRAARIGGPTM
jgi:tetratricopeptide (TPR) repeat protein